MRLKYDCARIIGLGVWVKIGPIGLKIGDLSTLVRGRFQPIIGPYRRVKWNALGKRANGLGTAQRFMDMIHFDCGERKAATSLHGNDGVFILPNCPIDYPEPSLRQSNRSCHLQGSLGTPLQAVRALRALRIKVFFLAPHKLPQGLSLLTVSQAPSKTSRKPSLVGNSLKRSRLSELDQEIPNSDPLDGSSIVSSPRIEIAVPPLPKKLKRQAQSTGRSRPPSSVDDSFDEPLTDYETPATSIAVTPRYGSHPSKQDRSSVGTGLKSNPKLLALRTSDDIKNTTRSSSPKRRVQDSEVEGTDEMADARLARQLQAEEYQYQDDSARRPSGNRTERPFPILNSEEWANEPSITAGIDSSDDGQPLASRRRRGPSRSSFRRSNGQMASSALDPPFDEESDLSELNSDYFNEESEASSANSSPAVEQNADDDHVNIPVPQHHLTPPRRGWNRHRRHHRTSSWDPLDPRGNRARRERRKLETAHPEIKTMWDSLKEISPIKPVESEQPTVISRKLKSFQLEGLNWMIRQEKSQWKGGLLGDEMGMGKTIQAVSLIMSDFPAKQPTLVVVPPVALMQWQSEIKSYTDGKLKVLVYHNTNPKVKHMKVKDLRAFNIIIVSYSGLESMYRKENKGWSRNDGIVKEDSVLHAIHFHRLILDEAHSIKQRTTSVARACFALKADYKWCLSGTPVQNRIGEFFSLLRFLDVVPFACYFCKMCKCKELHWSQNENKMCNHCNHSGFSHVSVFNQEILNPITQNENPQLRRDALDKLRLITDRIMLRRIKRDQTAAMELPPKEVIIHNEFFGEIERDFSQSVMGNSQRKFDTYVSRGVMLNNYANIFGLIMQMRQVANHPDLILKSMPRRVRMFSSVPFVMSQPKRPSGPDATTIFVVSARKTTSGLSMASTEMLTARDVTLL